MGRLEGGGRREEGGQILGNRVEGKANDPLATSIYFQRGSVDGGGQSIYWWQLCAGSTLLGWELEVVR